MYSDLKNVQIIIALLKKYNINTLVLSAGTRHTPFVRSVEGDDFFNCHSVVDERSAGFFALGLIRQLKRPVVICCTSGTAASNYLSPVSEAFYEGLPLIVLTADRNSYYTYQHEDQMVPQVNIYKDVIKKSVTLPFVNNDKDFWYCQRLVNEALLQIEKFGDGPVHINFPVEENLFSFTTESLPEVKKINIINPSDEDKWVQKSKELLQSKRILLLYGQSLPITKQEKDLINQFAEKYNVVIAVDHLSNLKGKSVVNVYNAIRTNYHKIVSNLVPDLVISMCGNFVEITEWLKQCSGKFTYWNIDKGGEIKDPFRCLTEVFNCTEMNFFKKMLEYCGSEGNTTNEYLGDWNSLVDNVKKPSYAFSDLFVVEKFLSSIPKNSMLNLGNSNTVRYAQQFNIDESINVYCNRGVCGIDGSVSAFIGQSYYFENLSFLLVGDLSFFYDMNALWNRYIKNNVRILINNNSCGEIFYTNAKQDKETVGRHIAADHNTSAKGWAQTCGFTYLEAKTEEEFNKCLQLFVKPSEKPIIFEVFTDKKINISELDNFYKINQEITKKQQLKNSIKKFINK